MTDGEVIHIAGQIEPPADFDATYIVVARDGQRWTFADAMSCAAFMWDKDPRNWRVFRAIRPTGVDLRAILDTDTED